MHGPTLSTRNGMDVHMPPRDIMPTAFLRETECRIELKIYDAVRGAREGARQYTEERTDPTLAHLVDFEAARICVEERRYSSPFFFGFYRGWKLAEKAEAAP